MTPALKNLARCAALALAAISLSLFASTVSAQSLPGYQAPQKPATKDDTPIALKAARGEVPLSKVYGHLKVDAEKVKHLGQLNAAEQKRKQNDKFLRIGVVRTLPTPLDPLSDSVLYTVNEGDVRVAGVVSDAAVAV